MKYKKGFILLVLAIFIFGVASVCASDANTAFAANVDEQATEIIEISELGLNNVASDDSQILGLSNSNEILKEPTTVTNHTFDAIESAINEGYDTIYLEQGIYTGKDGIRIIENENVNIIGNSAILDAHFSSNGSVVKIVDDSFVAAGEGMATIAVSFNGTDKYADCNASVAGSVEKIVTVIKLNKVSYMVYVDDVRDNLAVLQDGDGNNITDEYVLTYISSNDSVVKIVDDSFVAVSEGMATITVSFNGTDKYEAADNVIFNVVVFKIPTEILIQNKTLDMKVGDVADPVVSLMPSDAGNLTFISYDPQVVSVDNKGVVTAVSKGITLILVRFDGNDKYISSSAPITVSVSKVTFDPEITRNDTNVTVIVPEDADGEVKFAIGNETFATPIEGGVARFDLSDVPSGDYNASIAYYGDEKYVGFEVVYPISIEDKFILSADDLTKYYGGPERFVVKLTDRKGNPIAKVNVSIYVNGVEYNRTTNDDGQASMGIKLEVGQHTAVVSYNGSSIDASITILSTINGTDLVKIHRNATQYYVTALNSNGDYFKEGQPILFNINGVMYERRVSGDKGLVKLNINLNPGTYIITAMNPVTGERSANNITVLSRFTENNDITKYYRNATQYTAKILGDDGKAVGAGETVNFNINGVFYQRQTDAKGIVKLNINLNPGNYVITAEYKECMVANHIKVLPILNATDITMKYRDGTQFKVSLVDDQGKPFAGKTITFNINGVFYDRVTGSDGMAKLNINLMPGEYIITSSYNGSNIANKITIKS